MVEIRRPHVQASSREFGVVSGSSGKTREVPARRIRLSNHDDPNTLTWPEIQRLGRSEETILVQRFDGTHAHKIAQEVDRGSRGIHVARSAQLVFQLHPRRNLGRAALSKSGRCNAAQRLMADPCKPGMGDGGGGRDAPRAARARLCCIGREETAGIARIAASMRRSRPHKPGSGNVERAT